jgi:S-adenosylmethionine:tRNA ribosyltransferase-isomerase
MHAGELEFERPRGLEARQPPEYRGLARDEVRLLVSQPQGHQDAQFIDLPGFLEVGDLLVVNESATLPASLPATGPDGPFRIHVSTRFGDRIYLVEPRRSAREPGPLPFRPGDRINVGDVRARLVVPYPGLPRLWFLRTEASLEGPMLRYGRPIHYSYVDGTYPLAAYQTAFARVPGSAEVPSAGRPFTERVLDALRKRGVKIAKLILHTGVSSLEVQSEDIEAQPLYPEPFEVPVATARAILATRGRGGRVIAVGTTVVRALESAWHGGRVWPCRGFTRRYVRPGHPVRVVDGLLTGFHDPRTTHLALLFAVAGPAMTRAAYAHAVRRRYLWHEFGDSHLILPYRLDHDEFAPWAA